MMKMTEKDEFNGLIARIVREEIESIVDETRKTIAEVVRSELIPELRAAIRGSIAKELASATFDVESKKEREVAISSEGSSSQTVMTEDRMVEIETDQRLEERAAFEVEADEVEVGFNHGLYLYGVVDVNVSTKLGGIGIEGSEVFTVPYNGLSAVVHICPLEPYQSDDDETVKNWVKTHQNVMDVATENFGTVMPLGFDTIIAPEDGTVTAIETLKKWISDNYEDLMRKMEIIRGRMEYGVQIFYIPSIMGEKIEQECEDVIKIKEDMKSKSPGLAYMYKQKLEDAVKTEMEARMNTYFREFYEKIRTTVENIKVEKVKKAENDRVMIMNLSVLTNEEKALGIILDEIDAEEGFSVRFTGPWQPYSFI